MPSTLTTENIFEKLNLVDADLHALLLGHQIDSGPTPARDATVLDVRAMPARPALYTHAGLARLLHDLASIELQAVELGLQTLNEYPDTPHEFREELAQITRQEAQHLQLCLREIDNLGHRWGDWPVHIGLWQGAGRTKNFLDRILMVHRHLEGSGLDAGESFLRKLHNSHHKTTVEAVSQIAHEEIAHVDFGSRWYRRVCTEQRIDPDHYFCERMKEFISWVPRREKIARERRILAGFREVEIDFLEDLRRSLN
jgi:uncharacterized ferritin-like protein (DUF455 family)